MDIREFQRMMGVTPKKKKETKDTDTPSDKTTFLNQKVSRKDLQKELNKLSPSDRVTTLTSHRRGEVFNQ